MSENTSFAFVANLLNVNCNLPFKVLEDCYFQKADSFQIDKIKKYFSDSGHFTQLFRFNLSPYELVYVEDTNMLQQNSLTGQHLEPQDWKYYVLNFYGGISKVYDLIMAANLVEIELEFGLQFIYYKEIKTFGIQENPTYTFNYFHEMNRSLPLSESIDDTNLQDIGSIYQYYQQLDEIKYPDIKEAINMLQELKHIPHSSKFKVLGLFTII
ncbi:hypothetical protein, partial [Nostoc sp. UCD120]